MNDKNIKHPQLDSLEEISYESPYAIITSNRVFALNPKSKDWESAELEDAISPQIKNGGKLDRRPLGSKLLAIGLVLVVLQLVPYLLFNFNPLCPLGNIVESIYFMTSMICVSVGTYFLIGSWLNARPHTTVLLTVTTDQKNIIAVFPDWDSAEAERFATQFRRAKRGI